MQQSVRLSNRVAIVPAVLAYSRSWTRDPRLGRPDVAGAALFLASEDSSFTAGHHLLADGGWMAY
jgi:NAD(P)-dependent dehydrogenase (short-subunit alcohol dehydrogenase family)